MILIDFPTYVVSNASRGYKEMRANALFEINYLYVDHLFKKHKGCVSACAREANFHRANFRRLYRSVGLDPADYRVKKMGRTGFEPATA